MNEEAEKAQEAHPQGPAPTKPAKPAVPGQGQLVLVPTPLWDEATAPALSAVEAASVKDITHWVVESHRQGRRALRALGVDVRLCTIEELNEHTLPEEVANLLKPALAGHRMGLVSDGGCPALADPGAVLVALAHRKGVQVWPLGGPASMVMALMASGLEGQRFAFWGYIPAQPEERRHALKTLEAEGMRMQGAQLFIEAPYRNAQVFRDMVGTLDAQTRVVVACALGTEGGFVRTHTVEEWRKLPEPDVHKRPTVFGLQPHRAAPRLPWHADGERAQQGPARPTRPAPQARQDPPRHAIGQGGTGLQKGRDVGRAGGSHSGPAKPNRGTGKNGGGGPARNKD